MTTPRKRQIKATDAIEPVKPEQPYWLLTGYERWTCDYVVQAATQEEAIAKFTLNHDLIQVLGSEKLQNFDMDQGMPVEKELASKLAAKDVELDDDDRVPGLAAITQLDPATAKNAIIAWQQQELERSQVILICAVDTEDERSAVLWRLTKDSGILATYRQLKAQGSLTIKNLCCVESFEYETDWLNEKLMSEDSTVAKSWFGKDIMITADNKKGLQSHLDKLANAVCGGPAQWRKASVTVVPQETPQSFLADAELRTVKFTSTGIIFASHAKHVDTSECETQELPYSEIDAYMRQLGC